MRRRKSNIVQMWQSHGWRVDVQPVDDCFLCRVLASDHVITHGLGATKGLAVQMATARLEYKTRPSESTQRRLQKYTRLLKRNDNGKIYGMYTDKNRKDR